MVFQCLQFPGFKEVRLVPTRPDIAFVEYETDMQAAEARKTLQGFNIKPTHPLLYAFALIHFLKAAEVDFADVLEKKNATVSLRQIIRELEATQQTVWSPVILNGSGFGIWANHSLVMASYLSRANAALIDLRELLAQG